MAPLSDPIRMGTAVTTTIGFHPEGRTMSDKKDKTDLATENGQDIVTVTINDLPKPIHRGRRSVAEIKKVGGVPLADDLEQLIEGKLVGLKDDANVTIKGGEIFVSHPKDSSSSHWPSVRFGVR